MKGTPLYFWLDASSDQLNVPVGTAKPRSAKKFPEFMKSFGWCTWDAFYSQVSAQGTDTQKTSHVASALHALAT